MPSWITSALKKDKKSQRKRGLTVRFVDMCENSSTSLSSPLHSSTCVLNEDDRSRSDESLSDHSSCSESSDHHEVYVDEEEKACLRHLDDLGHTLENTFKEVESIDAYVGRLRDDFDHCRLTEHRYMTCICSAKIARAACCKRQVETWREIQHEMQELVCHYCHQHNQHNLQLCDPDHADTSSESSSHSHEEEVNEVLGHLRQMTMFDLIVQRLTPGGNQKSFVEQWVLHGSP